MKSGFLCLLILVTAMTALSGATAEAKFSQTIYSVLRQPLPPEELILSQNDAEVTVNGPTFTYHVQKSSGVVSGLRVVRDGEVVIAAKGPADIRIDNQRLSFGRTTGALTILSRGEDKIVLQADGILRDSAGRTPEVHYTLVHTFFNDGVVVTTVRLTPRAELSVEMEIVHEFAAQGHFTHFLHKRRDEHGDAARRGRLPEPGHALRVTDLTSCLQVFSPTAALAIFTDAGATHFSRTNVDSAVVEVTAKELQSSTVSLSQFLVQLTPGSQPYRLKAGETFNFRIGLSVAPNRLPHPRMHDLRMFTWIGDAKFPYPTNEEISEVARLGFTLFQMHRLGTPGEPRPPAGELERVIAKVHEAGMLFLWEENADLLFASAPGVQELKAQGNWSRWQGFNYNGRYTAAMDPFCDLVATCLASPNGLAEYRLANLARMLERFEVDGIYLDNNLAYPNCTLTSEHGHPQRVYDCLIELHEMNWRRRELLRRKRPHTVLISHNSRGIVLPVVCDFDVSLYGEGYSFDSVEAYWEFYRLVNSLPAQGMIWPGGDEPNRCAAALAYNFDLLTGGGQYSQTDWRMWPQKFPYATGVSNLEKLYVRTYNPAQFYFGLHESTPWYFANSEQVFRATASQTYPTIYHNRAWDEWLLVLANMHPGARVTALEFRSLQALGLRAEAEYVLFDLHQRTARRMRGDGLNRALNSVSIPGQNLQLFSLRRPPAADVFHLWGGKRISEAWDAKARVLNLEVHGPVGLQETLIIGGAGEDIQQVRVGGKPAAFSLDPVQRIAHGAVTFTSKPLRLEVVCSTNRHDRLPAAAISPSPLAVQLGSASR